MSLFAKSDAELALESAPQRMAWVRERGTKRLLFGFLGLIVLWFAYVRLSDHFLMQKTWPPLQADMQGLTVVGTLDARTDYERNLFRIIQANQTSRVELTEYGWRSIFTGTEGPLFSDNAGNAIMHARDVNGTAAYAMLEPYLRYAIARQLNKPDPKSEVTPQTPLTIAETKGTTTTEVHTTLGDQLEQFSGLKADKEEKETSDGGGSGSGRDVDHGMPIPADTLAKSCPVILNSTNFMEGWIEEQPATLLQGKTYMVHLLLTPEGRSRFFQWSHDHANESLIFILKDEIVAAPRIRETLSEKQLDIGPLRDGAAANALVHFVNSHKGS